MDTPTRCGCDDTSASVLIDEGKRPSCKRQKERAREKKSKKFVLKTKEMSKKKD